MRELNPQIDALDMALNKLTPEERRVLSTNAVKVAPVSSNYTVSDGIIKPAKAPAFISAMSASDLYDLDIPPIEWRVSEILPVGVVAMLSAKPKFFKSYLALGMCIAICQGEKYLGYQTKKCDCLYFDLESSKRRPKARIDQIMNGKRPPRGLYIVTLEQEVAKLRDGFEEQLIQQLQVHPNIGVVVIDVFNKIRKQKRASDDGYDRDYQDLSVLTKLAADYNVTILLISHHTKGQHTDAFDDTVGSAGIMGALDVAWSIKKDKRSDEDAVLHITGRDLESQELTIRFNTDTFQWERVGTKEEVEYQRQVRAYFDSNIIRAIKQALKENNGSYAASSTEIKAYGAQHNLPIPEAPQQIGALINSFEGLLRQDGIGIIARRDKSKRNFLFVYQQ